MPPTVRGGAPGGVPPRADYLLSVTSGELGATNLGALDALEALVARNREEPDPERERQIVQLRHDAYAEIDRSPGRESWPPELADPFPAARGIPEMDAARLSGELLGGAIVHHGCLRVNGLVAQGHVDRFVEYIDAGMDARDRLRDGAEPGSVGPWFVPFEPGRKRADGFGNVGFIPRWTCRGPCASSSTCSRRPASAGRSASTSRSGR